MYVIILLIHQIADRTSRTLASQNIFIRENSIGTDITSNIHNTFIPMTCIPATDSPRLLNKKAYCLIKKRQYDETVGLVTKALSLIKLVSADDSSNIPGDNSMTASPSMPGSSPDQSCPHDTLHRSLHMQQDQLEASPHSDIDKVPIYITDIDKRGASCLKKHAPTITTRKSNAMPPLSSFDNHAIALDWEPGPSYSTTSCSTTKGPLAPTKAQQQGVTFKQTVSVRKALHINDFSDSEIQAFWYDDDEFKAMRKDVKAALSMLNDGMLEEDNEYHCQRGLEPHTKKGLARRRQNKRAVREAVLTEQELQWEEDDVYDPEYIATVSMDVSSSSQATAHALGLKDQLDARMP
jgi:hypothetical protein